MSQQLIFIPFFAMMLLSFLVWLYMFAKRIPFIRSQQLSPEQLRPLEFTRLQPPEVSNPSDNLKNLFELPLFFYVLCLYLFVTEQVSTFYLVCAWWFVGFRCLHSLVHCTFNRVLLRFALYILAAAGLWLMLLGLLKQLIF